MTESELTEFIRQDLEAIGYTTYAEVCSNGGGSKRCDLYARFEDVNHNKYNYTIVFEAKLSFNLKLLEQIIFWSKKANEAYIIIPKLRKNSKNRALGKLICEKMGIGVMEVDFYNKSYDISVKSSVCDNPKLPKLFEQQKQSLASNDKSEYVTEFKLTVEKLNSYMLDKNDQVLSDVIKNIQHHYKSNSSANSAIKKLIERKIIKGFIISKQNGKITISKV